MSLPVLDAGRAILRPLELTDANALHAAYSDAAVCRYLPRPVSAGLAETEAAIARHLANGSNWAILDAELGEESAARGEITIFAGRWPGALEVGILLDRAAWGRGLARGALEAVVAYGFGPLDAHRVFADVDPENAASLRLFERAGFQREGVLRQTWRTHLGLRHSVILGRLRDP